MRILSGRAASEMVERLALRGSDLTKIEPEVRRIVDDVRRGGDRALRRYAQRWDGLKPNQPIVVSESELESALRSISPQLRTSLRQAAANIRRICE